jgi:hypothetical protein
MVDKLLDFTALIRPRGNAPARNAVIEIHQHLA